MASKDACSVFTPMIQVTDQVLRRLYARGYIAGREQGPMLPFFLLLIPALSRPHSEGRGGAGQRPASAADASLFQGQLPLETFPEHPTNHLPSHSLSIYYIVLYFIFSPKMYGPKFHINYLIPGTVLYLSPESPRIT